MFHPSGWETTRNNTTDFEKQLATWTDAADDKGPLTALELTSAQKDQRTSAWTHSAACCTCSLNYPEVQEKGNKAALCDTHVASGKCLNSLFKLLALGVLSDFILQKRCKARTACVSFRMSIMLCPWCNLRCTSRLWCLWAPSMCQAGHNLSIS